MEHGQLPFSAWPVVVLLPPVCLLFAACCSSVGVIGPVAHLQQHQDVFHFQPPNKSDKTPQHNLLNYKKIAWLIRHTKYHYTCILQKTINFYFPNPKTDKVNLRNKIYACHRISTQRRARGCL